MAQPSDPTSALTVDRQHAEQQMRQKQQRHQTQQMPPSMPPRGS